MIGKTVSVEIACLLLISIMRLQEKMCKEFIYQGISACWKQVLLLHAEGRQAHQYPGEQEFPCLHN